MNMSSPRVSSERPSSSSSACGRVRRKAGGDDISGRQGGGGGGGGGRRQQQQRSFGPKTFRSLMFTSRLSATLLVLATFLGIVAGSPMVVVEKDALARRSAASTASDDLPLSTRTTSVSSTRTSSSSTSTPSSSITIETPLPFDSVSLTSNLTTGCSSFLTTVTTNKTFQSCLPLSGLLRDSADFFEIMKKGAFATTEVLDRSCGVDVDACTSVMDSYSGQLRSSSNCLSDYNAQNPVVTNVYTALVAYRPLYAAGCLKASSGDYCFVDAVTNVESPEDLFIYSLALGTNLPDESRPTCDDCLVDTMRIFNAFAGNKTQPVSDTYSAAAKILNTGCGSNFVNTTVTIYDSFAVPRTPPWRWAAATIVVVVAAGFLNIF